MLKESTFGMGKKNPHEKNLKIKLLSGTTVVLAEEFQGNLGITCEVIVCIRFTSGVQPTYTILAVYQNAELCRLHSESSPPRLESLWQWLQGVEKRRGFFLTCGLVTCLRAILKRRWTSYEEAYIAVPKSNQVSTDLKKKSLSFAAVEILFVR